MARQSGWLRFGLPVLAGVSLVSAGLADFLFYDRVVGWTLGGFVAWLLLVMLIRNGRSVLTGPRRVWGWSLLLMTVGLCVSLVLEPGVMAMVLAVIALGSFAMLAHGWSSRRLGWAWIGNLFDSWVLALIRPILDSRLARRWAQRTRGLRNKALAAAKLVWGIAGVVVPVVLSLIFLGLFSLANPIVSDWMGRGYDKVNDFLFNVTEYVTFGRVLLWYAAGFLCWGLLRHRPRRVRRTATFGSAYRTPVPAAGEAAAHPVQAAAQSKRRAQDGSEPAEFEVFEQPNEQPSDLPVQDSPDMITYLASKYQNLIVRCLVAMNIVFALQLVLDSRYLVLGDALPDGMSYAEYAHRGAYPLIVTAILAAALVLAVFRPGGVAQRSALARWLVLVWIGQNIVLVASAAWRLGAYVEVYTLTRLRVAAAVWMLMVAGCLALLLWRIARSRDNSWLTGWAMGWGLAVLWVCSFVPFDPMIAQYNVMNCRELGGNAGSIDIGYLEHLGPDALPAVAYLLENLPEKTGEAPPAFEPEWDDSRGVRVDRIYYEPQDGPIDRKTSLHDQLERIRRDLGDELDDQLDDWRGWTVRRSWLSEAGD